MQTADLGVDALSATADKYCRDSVTHVVYHMIKVFNGGWCDYKAPYAPDGGVGSSVECFAQELDDGRCAPPPATTAPAARSCAAVDCDYATNCGGDVQDTDGTIHPERCKCSIITKLRLPGRRPERAADAAVLPSAGLSNYYREGDRRVATYTRMLHARDPPS